MRYLMPFEELFFPQAGAGVHVDRVTAPSQRQRALALRARVAGRAGTRRLSARRVRPRSTPAA